MNSDARYLPADRERVKTLADAMSKAIPDGTPSGYVMSALCMLLHFGLEKAPPELQDRIRATIQCLFSDRKLQ